MQAISNNQKNHLYEGGDVEVTISGETLDGALVTITEDDIIEGTFSIERSWVSGSTVEIGCAETSELVFELDNSDGRWSDIRWEGTRLTVVLDIDGEPLQAGIFTVDEPPRKLTTMQIRALDDMAKFNRLYDSTCPYPATLLQILQDACSKCGVTLYAQAFDNDSYLVTERPIGDDITYHHVVAWVAELAGCNAWIDHLARLRLSWYGENQPETPAMEFTRASTAYHPDTGEEIPADTPIYVDFAAGKKGSLMVEGTENYFNSADLRPENCPVEVIDRYNFRSAGDVEGAGGFSWSSGWLRLSGTQTYPTVILEEGYYTLSFTAELLQQGPYTPQIRLNLRGSDFHDAGLQIFNLSSTPTRFSYSLYVPEEKAPSTFLLAMNSNYVEFTNVQIEKKAYDTPFQIGTRANPTKQIVLPEALPDEFGIGVSFKPLHTTIPVTRTWLRIRREPHASANRIYIITNADVNSVFCAFVKDGTSYISVLNGAVEAGKITGIYYHQEPGKYTLYVRKHNGEIVSDSTNVTALTGLTTILVGCSVPATQYAANADFADFVLHDRPEDIDPMGYLSAIPGGGGE